LKASEYCEGLANKVTYPKADGSVAYSDTPKQSIPLVAMDVGPCALGSSRQLLLYELFENRKPPGRSPCSQPIVGEILMGGLVKRSTGQKKFNLFQKLMTIIVPRSDNE